MKETIYAVGDRRFLMERTTMAEDPVNGEYFIAIGDADDLQRRPDPARRKETLYGFLLVGGVVVFWGLVAGYVLACLEQGRVIWPLR